MLTLALSLTLLILIAAAFTCLLGIAHELIIKDDHTTYTPLDVLGGNR